MHGIVCCLREVGSCAVILLVRMVVQLVLQTPFSVTVNAIPVTAALEKMSKRRHALEPALYRHVHALVHESDSRLFGSGLSAALAERATAFDTKLQRLFPRLFSSAGASYPQCSCDALFAHQ